MNTKMKLMKQQQMTTTKINDLQQTTIMKTMKMKIKIRTKDITLILIAHLPV